MSHGEALADLIGALLSPLGSALLDPWRTEVNRSLLAATGADTAMFLLAEAGSTPCLALSPALIRDGCEERLIRLVAAGEVEGDADVVLEDDANERVVALVSGTASGAHAVLAAFHGPGGSADHTVELMRAVLPAFRAGVNLRRRFGARRAALARVLDGLRQRLLLCDDAGEVLHANQALARTLSRDPEAALQERMVHLAQVLVRTRPRALEGAVSTSLTREVQTNSATYRLHASYLPEETLGGGMGVLVSISDDWHGATDLATLERRLGLTSRQVETARLLASGHSNAEIARRLGISPFTVQKHVRKVLSALGVRSRGAVAAALHDTTTGGAAQAT